MRAKKVEVEVSQEEADAIRETFRIPGLWVCYCPPACFLRGPRGLIDIVRKWFATRKVPK